MGGRGKEGGGVGRGEGDQYVTKSASSLIPKSDCVVFCIAQAGGGAGMGEGARGGFYFTYLYPLGVTNTSHIHNHGSPRQS